MKEIKNHAIKQKSKTRSYIYVFLFVIIFFITSYILIILTRPLKPIYANSLPSPVSTNGEIKVSWPDSSQAAIGVLGYGSLTSNGVQTPTPTASIAKLVTALSVLNKYPLKIGEQGPSITLTNSDINNYNNYVSEGGSVVKVEIGEKISEYQAIQAMLLPSSNNMADTLATWAFGSISKYVISANIYVKSQGMNLTIISDASGFSPNTVSTSTDLVKLGEASLYNPVITEIVKQPSAILPVAGQVKNVDYFLGQYNLIGIKTGNTDQAGGCFLSAAKYDLGGNNSITIIGAVMKTIDLQTALNQTIPMLQSVKDQLQLKKVPIHTIVSSYTTPWGSKVTTSTKTNLQSPYLPGMPVSYKNTSIPLLPLVKSGAIVGNVQFSVGDDKSSSLVVLNSDLKKPNILWKISHPLYFLK